MGDLCLVSQSAVRRFILTLCLSYYSETKKYHNLPLPNETLIDRAASCAACACVRVVVKCFLSSVRRFPRQVRDGKHRAVFWERLKPRAKLCTAPEGRGDQNRPLCLSNCVSGLRRRGRVKVRATVLLLRVAHSRPETLSKPD